MFNEKIGVSYIFKAGKPGKKGYERAMQKIGTDKNNTVFIMGKNNIVFMFIDGILTGSVRMP